MKKSGAERRVFGWGNTIQLTPEKIKAAKAWWSSLSINEQRAAKVEHLGPDWPSATVTTDSNLVWMWEGEGSHIFIDGGICQLSTIKL